MRILGTVQWYDELKGFGFITPHAEGKDVFVHRSALPAGVVPAKHDIVEFEIVKGVRGRPQAARVTMGEPAAVTK